MLDSQGIKECLSLAVEDRFRELVSGPGKVPVSVVRADSENSFQ